MTPPLGPTDSTTSRQRHRRSPSIAEKPFMTHFDTSLVRAAVLTLTPGQQAAAEALATGATHAEAAEAAAVAREFVSRWTCHPLGLRAAVGLCRASLAMEQADRARRIRAKALEAVEAALDAGSIDPLAVLRFVPSSTDMPQRAQTGAELLDIETGRTLGTPSPLPPPGLLDDCLDQLCNPPPSDRSRNGCNLADDLDTALAAAADALELTGKTDTVADQHTADRAAYLDHRERTRPRREDATRRRRGASLAARRNAGADPLPLWPESPLEAAEPVSPAPPGLPAPDPVEAALAPLSGSCGRLATGAGLDRKASR